MYLKDGELEDLELILKRRGMPKDVIKVFLSISVKKQ